MTSPDQDPVTLVLGQLLRQPEPQRELALERALLRLQAARPDAAYLLLHRVLVLETALLQIKQSATAAASPAVATAGAAAGTPPTRSFLRDAAVVTAGVVAGQALWQGLADDPTDGIGDAFDLDGWL